MDIYVSMQIHTKYVKRAGSKFFLYRNRKYPLKTYFDSLYQKELGFIDFVRWFI